MLPDDVFGLPVHPLAVHAPIMLVPLLALIATAYALWPRVRRATGWALLALSVAAPAAVYVAKLSGEELEEQRLAQLAAAPEAAATTRAAIEGHSRYGDTLIWIVLALASVAWIVTAVASGRVARVARLLPAGSGRRRVVLVVAGVVLVALSAVAVGYVVRAGHTGAAMIWGA